VKRAATLSLLLVLAATGLVAQAPPASTAVSARRLFTCRNAEPNCWPTSFAFTPNRKRVFYVERFSGQVRVRNLGTRTDNMWTTIPDVQTAGSEQGLLGLALDPAWKRAPARRWVYVYYTHDASPDENVIARLRKENGALVTEELETISDAVSTHNGGVIDFGPDGKLYAVTGDGQVKSRSQDKQDPAGKVLRINRDGSIPGPNPFPGSPAFSFGHRNSFGFSFDPRTGRLWQTENGPGCNDEVNLVLKGENYAWGPNESCGSLPAPRDTNRDGPTPRHLPKRFYRDPIAITGAAFCGRCGLGSARDGDLLVGAWKDGIIRALDLTDRRRGVRSQQLLYDHHRGILGMESGPRHRVFFSDPTGVFRLVRS
jgi:glucose/arabinose dehydrogenase